MADNGCRDHHDPDRDGGRHPDLSVGVHSAARQGLAVAVEGAAAWVDFGGNRVRGAEVRLVEHLAERHRRVVDGAGLRSRHRAVSYTHLRAHETDSYLVCRLLL